MLRFASQRHASRCRLHDAAAFAMLPIRHTAFRRHADGFIRYFSPLPPHIIIAMIYYSVMPCFTVTLAVVTPCHTVYRLCLRLPVAMMPPPCRSRRWLTCRDAAMLMLAAGACNIRAAFAVSFTDVLRYFAHTPPR